MANLLLQKYVDYIVWRNINANDELISAVL